MRFWWVCPVFVVACFVFMAAPALAAPNPAAVYCKELGNEYRIEKGPNGETGVCILPREECGEWEFLQGRCGKGQSYCVRHGYGIKSVSSGEAVCLVTSFSGDGKKLAAVTEEVPVGRMMNLEGPYVAPKEGGVPAATGGAPVSDPFYNASDFSFWDWRDPPAGTVYNQGNFTYFDSSNGWLTPVKDQGSCGSCWAFSSVGGIEARHELNRNNSRLNPDLSEEYMVSDCQDQSYQDCCGGWMEIALNFTMYEGISDDICFPYVDAGSCTCTYPHTCDAGCTYNTGNNCSDSACTDRCAGYADRLWTIGGADYSSYWTDFTNLELEQWVIEKGPVVVGLGIGSGCGGSFDGDIYRCTKDNCTNHGVVLVGYNDTGVEATSYWILKNSWGTSWGESGYYKLGFGECNITEEVHYVNITNQPDFAPLVVLGDPENGNETDYDRIGFNFTAYNRTSPNITCDLVIDSNVTNTTQAVNATPAVMSYTLNPGSHEWKINCWEEGLGAVNSSGTRNLTVMVPPGITVTSPGNSTYETLPIDLNVSANESADWCGWNLNDTLNDTMSGSGTLWYDAIGSAAQGTQQLYVYCNDSAGNMGQNSSLHFTYLPESPKYWDNSTNSTMAGYAIEFSLRWTDNTGLSSYVLSLDNCTGSFANVTNGTLSGTEDWFNVTQRINNTVGCMVRWKVYANDSSGNWNVSGEYGFATTASCGCRLTGSLDLDHHIAGCTGTVFEIAADDVTLDCQNHYLQTSGNYGINNTGFNNFTVRNCRVNMSQGSYGIFYKSADNGTIENNTVFAGMNYSVYLYWPVYDMNILGNSLTAGDSFALYLYNADYTNVSDNNMTAGSMAICLYASSYNNVTGGSIMANSSDYYLLFSDHTNVFRNTNFTDEREIYFNDAVTWFKYSNQSSGGVWLNTSMDSSLLWMIYRRELINWSQSLVKWNETNVSSDEASWNITTAYSLEGLFADTYYNVNMDSVLKYNLQTDSNGVLPSFELYVEGEHEIIVEVDDVPPAILNTTAVPSILKPYSNLTITTKADDMGVDYVYASLYNSSWFNVHQNNMTQSPDDWSLVFNVSNLTEGIFYLNITAVDNAGNNATGWVKNLTVNQTSGAFYTFTNTSLSTTGNRTSVNKANFTIDINTSQEIINSSLTASSYSQNPGGAAAGLTGIGRYIELGTGQSLTQNLLRAVIRLFYTDQEVSDAGLDENNLGLYWYNETSGSWSLKTGGVNTSGNYVWGNTTRFSYYGIFGYTTTTTTTTTTLGSSGGGGRSPTTTTTTTTSTTAPQRAPVTGQATGATTTIPPTPGEAPPAIPWLPLHLIAIPLILAAIGAFILVLFVTKRRPKKSMKISEILLNREKYLGKKVVVSGMLSKVRKLEDGKTAYSIRGATGKILGMSRNPFCSGGGTVRGVLKKAGREYYVEF